MCVYAYVCACVSKREHTEGVRRITVIMSLPIHDMSDVIIHPGKTRVQSTSNGTLLIPSSSSSSDCFFMTDKVLDGSDTLYR